MRWKPDPNKMPVIPPRHGDTRVVKRFLLLPLALRGEMRWLETAYIRQQYLSKYSSHPFWWSRSWATEVGYRKSMHDRAKYEQEERKEWEKWLRHKHKIGAVAEE